VADLTSGSLAASDGARDCLRRGIKTQAASLWPVGRRDWHTRARLLIDRDAEATPWTRRPADTVTSASSAAAAAAAAQHGLNETDTNTDWRTLAHVARLILFRAANLFRFRFSRFLSVSNDFGQVVHTHTHTHFISHQAV